MTHFFINTEPSTMMITPSTIKNSAATVNANMINNHTVYCCTQNCIIYNSVHNNALTGSDYHSHLSFSVCIVWN